MKVQRIANEYQRVEYYIDSNGSFEDFLSLLQFIQNKYELLTIKGSEGVFMNAFQIAISGVVIVFSQLNNLGCRFYSKDGLDHPILKKIAADLAMLTPYRLFA
jgi:hypothetical protein